MLSHADPNRARPLPDLKTSPNLTHSIDEPSTKDCMSISFSYQFAKVARKPHLSHQFLQRRHSCSLLKLIAKYHSPKRPGFSHCQTSFTTSTLSRLIDDRTENIPLLSQAGDKMSALEDDGSNVAAHIAVEDKLADGKKKQRGGRGGGGGGQSREVLVSKALSRLLRHQAANAGIQLDAEGFAALDEVVSGHLLT